VSISISRLLRGDFVRHGLLVFFASFVVNACNYAFHFVASRRLGPTSYGDLYALITVLAFLGVVSASATTVIVRLTAELASVGDIGMIGSLLALTRRWSFLVAAGFAGLAIAAGGPIAGFLHLQDSKLVLPWAVVLAGSVVIPPLRAVMQGLQNFRTFAISTSIEATGKVAFGVTAVMVGFGTAGALGGQALGIVCAWIYSDITLRRQTHDVPRGSLHLDGRRLMAVTSGVVGSTLATTALLSIDALAAKHYLAPSAAGIYSAVSLAGKVLMFAVGFVPLVLLPKATAAAMRREPVLPTLIQGAAISIAMASIVLVFYAIAPTTILAVMVGRKYDAAAPFLLAYGFAMALLALTNTIVAFKIAIHRFEFVIPLLVTAAGEVIAIGFHHDDINAIVQVLLAAQIIAIVVCAVPWPSRNFARGIIDEPPLAAD
jgi:O-antigen/teichoic acid export membrane protein